MNTRNSFWVSVAIIITIAAFWESILPVLPVYASAEKTPVKFEQLGTRQGLSQNSVFCILKDSKGFMWFGTEVGVNRYDGREFKVFEPVPGDPNSLSHPIVMALCEDHTGALWVGTQKGLNRYDRNLDTFTRFSHEEANPGSLSSDFIRCIYEDSRQVLWIGTNHGLNRLERETGTFTSFAFDTDPYNPRRRVDIINTITEDSRGRLWFGTSFGLHRYNREAGTFTRYLSIPEDPGTLDHFYISEICEDRGGTLWIATMAGLNKLAPGGESFIRCNISLPSPQETAGTAITSMLEDSRGTFWVSLSTGIFTLDRKTLSLVPGRHSKIAPFSVGRNLLTCLYEDDTGIIWVGTMKKGVSKWSPFKRKFAQYDSSASSPFRLSYNSTSAIFEDRDGMLWIGNSNKGLDMLNRKKGTCTNYSYDSKDPGSLIHNNVLCIYEDNQRNLWIGTWGGLDKLGPRRRQFSHYRVGEQLPFPITSITGDPSGILWTGTTAGLFHFEPASSTFVPHKPDDYLPRSHDDGYVYQVIRDSRGMIWLATHGSGLKEFDPADLSYTHYKESGGAVGNIRTNCVLSVYEDRDGTIWAGTHGAGLAKFQRASGTFVHYTSRQGLPSNSICAIQGDDDGHLWISTNRGLVKFNSTTEATVIYNLSDGLQDYEFTAAASFKSPGGEMFFGGLNGVNAFFPGQVKPNPHIPPVVLTDLKIFNLPVPVGEDSVLKRSIMESGEITLSHGDKNFSFRFAALDFTEPGSNQYMYRMKGFSDRWVHLGNKNDMTFTNLDPGTYEFQVKGSNNNGVWNHEGTAVRVIITPPFWKTLWFRLLAVLIVLAAVYFWHRNRMHHLTRKLKGEARLELLAQKFNISNREQEIVELLLKGKSNKQIEEELYISLSTVKSHVHNIYKKLGVQGRTELVVFFREAGH